MNCSSSPDCLVSFPLDLLDLKKRSRQGPLIRDLDFWDDFHEPSAPTFKEYWTPTTWPCESAAIAGGLAPTCEKTPRSFNSSTMKNAWVF